MTDNEVYYIAGLLEGEGSFYACKGGRYDSISPRIQMASKDREVVEKISLLTGRRVYGPYRQRTCDMYTWFVTGLKAVELMMLVKPLMSLRRQAQIEAAISDSNTVPRAKL